MPITERCWAPSHAVVCVSLLTTLMSCR